MRHRARIWAARLGLRSPAGETRGNHRKESPRKSAAAHREAASRAETSRPEAEPAAVRNFGGNRLIQGMKNSAWAEKPRNLQGEVEAVFHREMSAAQDPGSAGAAELRAAEHIRRSEAEALSHRAAARSPWAEEVAFRPVAAALSRQWAAGAQYHREAAAVAQSHLSVGAELNLRVVVVAFRPGAAVPFLPFVAVDWFRLSEEAAANSSRRPAAGVEAEAEAVVEAVVPLGRGRRSHRSTSSKPWNSTQTRRDQMTQGLRYRIPMYRGSGPRSARRWQTIFRKAFRLKRRPHRSCRRLGCPCPAFPNCRREQASRLRS